jgi:uncharacterized membrane protein
MLFDYASFFIPIILVLLFHLLLWIFYRHATTRVCPNIHSNGVCICDKCCGCNRTHL